MATATSYTAARMAEIEASCVVSGAVDLNGDLKLTTRGGLEINAGMVRDSIGISSLLTRMDEVENQVEVYTDYVQNTTTELTSDVNALQTEKLDAVSGVSTGLTSLTPLYVESPRTKDVATKEYVDILANHENAPRLTGDYSSLSAWKALKSGTYMVWGEVTAGLPKDLTHGFVQVMRHDLDGAVILHQQSTGRMYKFAWNSNSTTVDWMEVPFAQRIITGTPNLNNYIHPGTYYVNATSVASGGSNFPAPIAGMLEVFSNPSNDNFIYQRYTGFAQRNNNVSLRGRYNGTWSSWNRLGGHLAGSINTSGATNTVRSVSISYPTGHFTSAPALLVTPNTTRPDLIWSGATTTATGGIIYTYRTSATDYEVMYLAMERQ